MTLIRLRRAALAAFALTLAFTGALQAGSEGRVIGTVVDEKGTPLEGAKVLVTRLGANYKLEKTSDKKGQVTLLILDASQEYQVRVEKPGYKPFEGPIQPRMEDTMRLTFNLVKDAPAPTPETKELSGNDQAILAYNDGVTALRNGDIGAAAPKLEQAASLDPNLAEAHAALAEVYLEMKRNGEALAAADRYLALRPGDSRGLRARYDALKAAGDEEKAREALKALGAGAKDEETAVRFFNQGAEMARSGNLDEAANFFQKVVEIAPTEAKFAKAHYVLGLNLAKDESKKAEARQHLESFLKLAPDDPDAKTAQEMLEYLK